MAKFRYNRVNTEYNSLPLPSLGFNFGSRYDRNGQRAGAVRPHICRRCSIETTVRSNIRRLQRPRSWILPYRHSKCHNKAGVCVPRRGGLQYQGRRSVAPYSLYVSWNTLNLGVQLQVFSK
jgi:hypothetical protein